MASSQSRRTENTASKQATSEKLVRTRRAQLDLRRSDPRLKYQPATFAQRCGAWLIDAPFLLLFVYFCVKAVETSNYGCMIGALSSWLYFPYMESSAYQASLGKILMGIRVCDANHSRLSFLRALGRHSSRCVAIVLTCGLGLLSAAFTSEHYTLYDLASGTYVLKR